jgi:mRNA-degrading endonuclease RelE of RelBE toxin-antitoxin system
MAYQIRFEEEATEHLGEFTARERSTILYEIENQLIHQPNVRTRHRKQLRPNPLAKWQLSVGDSRIFYDVDEPANEVVILAIGRKAGNRFIIGGKEYKI